MEPSREIEDLAKRAVEVAVGAGATYADARFVAIDEEALVVEDRQVQGARTATSAGIGIRVIAEGCWGFAATAILEPTSLEATARLALEVARASTTLATRPVRLVEVEPVQAHWVSAIEENPFAVPVEEKLELLVKANEAMLAVPGVSIAIGRFAAWRRRSLFVSSEGSHIVQDITQCGAGIEATAVGESEIQNRSFPNSFGGDFKSEGFELIRRLDLVGNAGLVAEQAVALLSAEQCPSEVTTVVLDGSQVALQVHESVGHPVELDRVLGAEAAYAGTSFLVPDDRGRLRYGSPAMNIVADATTPGALGTFGFDDEGVPAASTPIVTEGVFAGFLSSRETASDIGLDASGGTVRAESWEHLPIIRMTNVSLLPGQAASLEELLDGIDHGIYMETNRSWSIDDRRVDFQFGTEWGQEIKQGRLGKTLRNCTYAGRTQPFWSSLDAVGGPPLWRAWGLPNCGKGQPPQTGFVGHGAAPSRFRSVRVGVR